jgi:hypothetical protein
MGLKRPVLERSLEYASGDLAAWVKVLESRGVTVKAFKRCPKWREFNAKVRQIRRRINAVAVIEAREVECLRMKAEKQAATAGATE